MSALAARLQEAQIRLETISRFVRAAMGYMVGRDLAKAMIALSDAVVRLTSLEAIRGPDEQAMDLTLGALLVAEHLARERKHEQHERKAADLRRQVLDLRLGTLR